MASQLLADIPMDEFLDLDELDITQLWYRIQNFDFFRETMNHHSKMRSVPPLLRCMRIEKYDSVGEQIYSEGETMNKFYVVLQGQVHLNQKLSKQTPQIISKTEMFKRSNTEDARKHAHIEKECCIKEIMTGQYFGEHELIYQMPRKVSAVSIIKNTIVGSFTYSNFQGAISDYVIKLNPFFNFSSSLLQMIPKEGKLNLAYACKSKELNLNEYVYKQGSSIESIYFLGRGSLSIIRNDNHLIEESMPLRVQKRFQEVQVICGIPQHSFFGDEDLLNLKGERAYSAIITSNLALVYSVDALLFNKEIQGAHGIQQSQILLENYLEKRKQWRIDQLSNSRQIKLQYPEYSPRIMSGNVSPAYSKSATINSQPYQNNFQRDNLSENSTELINAQNSFRDKQSSKEHINVKSLIVNNQKLSSTNNDFTDQRINFNLKLNRKNRKEQQIYPIEMDQSSSQRIIPEGSQQINMKLDYSKLLSFQTESQRVTSLQSCSVQNELQNSSRSNSLGNGRQNISPCFVSDQSHKNMVKSPFYPRVTHLSSIKQGQVNIEKNQPHRLKMDYFQGDNTGLFQEEDFIYDPFNENWVERQIFNHEREGFTSLLRSKNIRQLTSRGKIRPDKTQKVNQMNQLAVHPSHENSNKMLNSKRNLEQSIQDPAVIQIPQVPITKDYIQLSDSLKSTIIRRCDSGSNLVESSKQPLRLRMKSEEDRPCSRIRTCKSGDSKIGKKINDFNLLNQRTSILNSNVRKTLRKESIDDLDFTHETTVKKRLSHFLTQIAEGEDIIQLDSHNAIEEKKRLLENWRLSNNSANQLNCTNLNEEHIKASKYTRTLNSIRKEVKGTRSREKKQEGQHHSNHSTLTPNKSEKKKFFRDSAAFIRLRQTHTNFAMFDFDEGNRSLNKTQQVDRNLFESCHQRVLSEETMNLSKINNISASVETMNITNRSFSSTTTNFLRRRIHPEKKKFVNPHSPHFPQTINNLHETQQYN